MNIGTIVAYNTNGHSDSFARGRVVARETYENANGKQDWVYVRWFSVDGRPDEEAMRHATSELIEIK